MTSINAGCGYNKLTGYINIDKFRNCSPDLVADLEDVWPFDDNSVDEIVFCHSLEHMGETTEKFLFVVKELYRVSKNGTMIRIIVPYPRHNHFLNDPTHVRPITEEILDLFSKKKCLDWISKHHPNTPLALYHNVDFEIESVKYAKDPNVKQFLEINKIDTDDYFEILSYIGNNFIIETTINWRVVKEESK